MPAKKLFALSQQWLLAAILGLSAGFALAQEDLDYQQGDALTEPADAEFDEIDRDGDSRISQEEATDAGFGDHFDIYDRNDDDELTLEEYHDLDRRLGNDTLNP